MNRRKRQKKYTRCLASYALKLLSGQGSIKVFFKKLMKAKAKLSDLALKKQEKKRILFLELRSIGIPKIITKEN